MQQDGAMSRQMSWMSSASFWPSYIQQSSSFTANMFSHVPSFVTFINWFILLYKISILAILYMHEILLILRFKYKYNINIYYYTWIKVSIFIIEMNTKNTIQLRWIDKFSKCTCQMSRELTASFLMVSGGSENNETRFRERVW